MTLQEIHDFFDVVQDHYNEPYFLDGEKDSFINRAQEQFVNNIIFRDILGEKDNPKGPQAIYGAEDSIFSNEILSPLITVDKSISSNASGSKVLYTDISANLMHVFFLRASSSNTGNITNTKKLRFIRFNDEGAFEDNTFKKGSTSKPYYKIGSDGIYLYPVTGATELMNITYIDKPTDVELGVQECIMPSYTHKKIVTLALGIAGVPTENQVLMMMDDKL